MRRCSLETCICHLEPPRPHAGVSTLAFIPLRPRDPSWGPGMFTDPRTHVSRGSLKGTVFAEKCGRDPSQAPACPGDWISGAWVSASSRVLALKRACVEVVFMFGSIEQKQEPVEKSLFKPASFLAPFQRWEIFLGGRWGVRTPTPFQF